MKTENYEATDLERTPFISAIDPEPGEENDTEEQDADHQDSDDELTDNDEINSDEDLHEAGNIGERDSEKDELSGPANDLIGQPADEDGD